MIERNPSPYGWGWRWRREPPPAVHLSDAIADLGLIVSRLFRGASVRCRHSRLENEPTTCSACLNLTRSLVMKNPVQRLCVECLANKTETVGGMED